MRKRLSVLISFTLILFAFLGCISGSNTSEMKETENKVSKSLYKVVKIVDGDTIVVNMEGVPEKVRLIGINTPEIHHRTKGVEFFGPEAALYTKRLLLGKKVRLEYDAQKRDKYGRILAYVYLPDGTLMNAKLVAEGYAQVMTVPPNVKYAEKFISLQREARRENRGLWQQNKKMHKIVNTY